MDEILQLAGKHGKSTSTEEWALLSFMPIHELEYALELARERWGK